MIAAAIIEAFVVVRFAALVATERVAFAAIIGAFVVVQFAADHVEFPATERVPFAAIIVSAFVVIQFAADHVEFAATERVAFAAELVAVEFAAVVGHTRSI